MSKFMRNVLHVGKHYKVSVATNMQHKGYERAARLIEPRLINDNIDRLETALKETNVLPKEKAKEVEEAIITYVIWLPSVIQWKSINNRCSSMDHTSPSDANRHSTMLLLNAQGQRIATLHVTHDPDQQ